MDDALMGPLVICYHGTTEENAASILREGFHRYTYFARHLENAVGFGGPHIFEVVFSQAAIGQYGWQFKAPGQVSPDRIVGYYTVEKTVNLDNQGLRERVFRSNMHPSEDP